MLCNWLVQAAVALREPLVTADPQIARQFITDAARTHGRIQILNEESAKESTWHGSPLPQLLHGGPGRAGGGEELGGLRAVKHYMQRTAVQGSPTMLAAISKQWRRVRKSKKIVFIRSANILRSCNQATAC
ncbi:hypothetical protein ACLK10_07735 [Escherichia coli]